MPTINSKTRQKTRAQGMYLREKGVPQLGSDGRTDGCDGCRVVVVGGEGLIALASGEVQPGG